MEQTKTKKYKNKRFVQHRHCYEILPENGNTYQDIVDVELTTDLIGQIAQGDFQVLRVTERFIVIEFAKPTLMKWDKIHYKDYTLSRIRLRDIPTLLEISRMTVLNKNVIGESYFIGSKRFADISVEKLCEGISDGISKTFE